MLTKAQIDQIVAKNGGMWTDPETGRFYRAQYSGGSENGSNELEGFIGSDVANNSGYFSVGTPVSHYDVTGNKLGNSYNVQEPQPMFSGVGDFLKFIAPVAGAAGLGWLASGAGLGAATNGAFLGEGVASGVPAWDGAMTMSGIEPGMYSAAADGAGGYISDTPEALNGAFLGEGTTSGIPAWDKALTTASSGGSWLDKLAGAVGGKENLRLLGGLGSGLLSAASPAPQSTRQSQMDPRLDPYVFGEQGVVPRASLLYQNRTNPTSQTMADRAALRAKAKGLLGI